MSTTPITIAVTYRCQAYHCRLQGIAASSTSNPQAAAQRLADKVFSEGTHIARMVRDCTASEPGEWVIEPATLPGPLQLAGVRITLADDGHYYLDVRRAKATNYRAHSRHGSLDAAIEQARATLAMEAAA